MHIRILETGDASRRGAFYDKIGALRDVGQNHLLETVALLTMERPHTANAETIHRLRTEALEYFSNALPHSIIRGQYRGFVGTAGVGEHSETETYFKLETKLKADMWGDVLFTIESGKALHENVADAVIVFREGQDRHKNVLRIGFSPKPYVSYDTPITLPKQDTLPDGYERVLFDCMIGDQTRFVSRTEILAAWQFVTPILEAFNTTPLVIYEPGSSGPVID